MVRCLLLAYGLSLLQGPVHADERKTRVGLSPCRILVHEVDTESPSLVFRQGETICVLEEVQLAINGKIVTRTRPTYRSVPAHLMQVKLSLKDINVFDGTGTLLGEAEILKRVKPGMEVMIARWDDQIGLDYLFVFKKETLILVLPRFHDVPNPKPGPGSLLLFLDTVAYVCDDFVSWVVFRIP